MPPTKKHSKNSRPGSGILLSNTTIKCRDSIVLENQIITAFTTIAKRVLTAPPSEINLDTILLEIEQLIKSGTGWNKWTACILGRVIFVIMFYTTFDVDTDGKIVCTENANRKAREFALYHAQTCIEHRIFTLYHPFNLFDYARIIARLVYPIVVEYCNSYGGKGHVEKYGRADLLAQ